MSRILITGASGLLGSAIAHQLVEEGDVVFALCRPNSDLSLLESVKSNLTILEGDILDVYSIEETLNHGIDYVIHAAAIVSFAPKDRNQMFKTNVEGTANLVNVCLNKKIKKLCFISSIAAIGRPNNGDTIVDENQKWEDSPLNSNYAKSKFQAELEVWRGQAEGLDVVVVNPSIILGEGDWYKSSTKLFKYVFDSHKYYTKGDINFVDRKDVVEIVCKLTKSEIKNEKFILNGGTISYHDFFAKIAQQFNKKAPKRVLSDVLVGVLWRLEAIRAFLTGASPLITRETAINSSTKFAYKSIKVQKTLQMNFTSIDETVERVCKYLVEKYSKNE